LKHISAKSLKKWIVIFPSSARDLTEALVESLGQVCVPFGMEVVFPEV